MNPTIFSRTGQTRSALRRDHALIAPDGHVVTALPAWGGALGVVLLSPAMGANLAQTLIFLDPEAQDGGDSFCFEPPMGVEACFYVLEGELWADGRTLRAGSYVFLPAGEAIEVKVISPSRLVAFEKRYAPNHARPNGNLLDKATKTPPRVIGHADDIEAKPFLGDPDAVLQVLLPETPDFDMAINIFSYQPGATLPFVETHVMEHGLLMLDGEGIYRLSDNWYPVAAGDAIWMAPFCPQWFAATGKVRSRYIYFKNVARDAMELP